MVPLFVLILIAAVLCGIRITCEPQLPSLPPLCFRLLPVVVNSVRHPSKSPSKIWCCNDATRGQSARPGSRVWTQP